MNNIVRFPPVPFWPDDLDEREAEWEAPDALTAREAERMALQAPWPFLITVGASLLGWGCIVNLALMAVAVAYVVMEQ